MRYAFVLLILVTVIIRLATAELDQKLLKNWLKIRVNCEPVSVCSKCDEDSAVNWISLYDNLTVRVANSSNSLFASSGASPLPNSSLVTAFYRLHFLSTVCRIDDSGRQICPAEGDCQLRSIRRHLTNFTVNRGNGSGGANSQLCWDFDTGAIRLWVKNVSEFLSKNQCRQYFKVSDLIAPVGNGETSCKNETEMNAEIANFALAFLEEIAKGKCIQQEAADQLTGLAGPTNKDGNISCEPRDNLYGNKIFDHYAIKDREREDMDINGIEELLTHLGLTSEPDPNENEFHKTSQMQTPGQMKEEHEQCLEPRTFFKAYDYDNSSTINKNEFIHMCPHLIYQLALNRNCNVVEEETFQEAEVSRAEAYGYGSVAVFIISLMSTSGFFILPHLSEQGYEYAMACFIALAFGTLSGDATLHLIPEALGLHDESGGHQDHDEGIPDYFWKMLGILLTFYLLFVFESMTEYVVERAGKKKPAQRRRSISDSDSRSSIASVETPHGHSHNISLEFYKEQRRKKDKGHANGINMEVMTSEQEGAIQPVRSSESIRSTTNLVVPSTEEEDEGLSATLFGLKTLAWIIIIGDGIHNVTDGMAIGAAFNMSLQSGISTSLAVLFHEIPHELGDFAVLLSTGMSFKKAMVWNFLSALTAFIGLFIGLSVGQNEIANQWIFTISAGIFIIVALGDMLPQMRNTRSKNPGKVLIFQNIGAILGMLSMVLLAVFEENLAGN